MPTAADSAFMTCWGVPVEIKHDGAAGVLNVRVMRWPGRTRAEMAVLEAVQRWTRTHPECACAPRPYWRGGRAPVAEFAHYPSCPLHAPLEG